LTGRGPNSKGKEGEGRGAKKGEGCKDIKPEAKPKVSATAAKLQYKTISSSAIAERRALQGGSVMAKSVRV